MLTEKRSPRTANIDRLSTLAVLEVMNDEDATVPGAVRRVLPAIAQAVDAIVEHLRQGGRLLYVGAGTSGRLGVLDAVECVPTFNTDPETVQGIIAVATAMLITAWIASSRPMPDARYHAVVSPERRPILRLRLASMNTSPSTRSAPSRPSSAPTTQKMESV